jgi:hypothetical protein
MLGNKRNPEIIIANINSKVEVDKVNEIIEKYSVSRISAYWYFLSQCSYNIFVRQS